MRTDSLTKRWMAYGIFSGAWFTKCPVWPMIGPTWLIWYMSHCMTLARPRTSRGRSCPVFSARWIRIAPDSKIASGPPVDVVVDDGGNLLVRVDRGELRA